MSPVKKLKKNIEQDAQEEEKTSKLPGGRYFHGIGKRKTSVANVRLYKGQGIIVVNESPIAKYLPVKTLVELVKSPLKMTDTLKNFDISVLVKGGGISSQAEAIRHGISKALVEMDPINKTVLRKAGMITRDSRIKERKKFGLHRARKAPQFSKR